METWVVVCFVGCVLYVCGRFAQDVYRCKGRSPLHGFLLGLLGPLGVLAAQATPKVDLRHRHRCVHCRRWILDDATRCPHCRRGMKVDGVPAALRHSA